MPKVPGSVDQLYNQFSDSTDFLEIISLFDRICEELQLDRSAEPRDFYQQLKTGLSTWKSRSLWELLDRKASSCAYEDGTAGQKSSVLVVGAGPCGLRFAIEAAFLGARKVVVVEKRTSFSRNNVLHLWPFTMEDLKSLGAKKFFGKFGAGKIYHISIRMLQAVLLKTCLSLGIHVHPGVEFHDIVEPREQGWNADVRPAVEGVSGMTFDVVVGADGRRSSLLKRGFKQKEFRAKLAIAITVNFVNDNTTAEAAVPELPGVSYVYKRDFFDGLASTHGIELENIVYYKDETHYFVMTAKKSSLIAKKVLKKDSSDAAKLVSSANIDINRLCDFAREAAKYATDAELPKYEFAQTVDGRLDVALFDFTSMYATDSAARIFERKGKKLMVALVGDSLLEPFWPMGTGCARGFLSCMDTAWMMKGFMQGHDPIQLLKEREGLMNLLPQTTPNRLQQNHAAYSIHPETRYLNAKEYMRGAQSCAHLYNCDDTKATVPIVEPVKKKPKTIETKIPKVSSAVKGIHGFKQRLRLFQSKKKHRGGGTTSISSQESSPIVLSPSSGSLSEEFTFRKSASPLIEKKTMVKEGADDRKPEETVSSSPSVVKKPAVHPVGKSENLEESPSAGQEKAETKAVSWKMTPGMKSGLSPSTVKKPAFDPIGKRPELKGGKESGVKMMSSAPVSLQDLLAKDSQTKKNGQPVLAEKAHSSGKAENVPSATKEVSQKVTPKVEPGKIAWEVQKKEGKEQKLNTLPAGQDTLEASKESKIAAVANPTSTREVFNKLKSVFHVGSKKTRVQSVKRSHSKPPGSDSKNVVKERMKSVKRSASFKGIKKVLKVTPGPKLSCSPTVKKMASALNKLCIKLPADKAELALEVLASIIVVIQNFSDEDDYRRLNTSSPKFEMSVWDHVEAQDFLLASGWMPFGDFIVFPVDPSDAHLSEALECLQQRKQEFQRKLWKGAVTGGFGLLSSTKQSTALVDSIKNKMAERRLSYTEALVEVSASRLLKQEDELEKFKCRKEKQNEKKTALSYSEEGFNEAAAEMQRQWHQQEGTSQVVLRRQPSSKEKKARRHSYHEGGGRRATFSAVVGGETKLGILEKKKRKQEEEKARNFLKQEKRKESERRKAESPETDGINDEPDGDVFVDGATNSERSNVDTGERNTSAVASPVRSSPTFIVPLSMNNAKAELERLAADLAEEQVKYRRWKTGRAKKKSDEEEGSLRQCETETVLSEIDFQSDTAVTVEDTREFEKAAADVREMWQKKEKGTSEPSLDIAEPKPAGSVNIAERKDVIAVPLENDNLSVDWKRSYSEPAVLGMRRPLKHDSHLPKTSSTAIHETTAAAEPKGPCLAADELVKPTGREEEDITIQASIEAKEKLKAKLKDL
eukprot:m.75015 g.75015  ORF g.75015 m.75015 type:complete len:1378 (+) comp35924_c0_seq5:1629-5762(+)